MQEHKTVPPEKDAAYNIIQEKKTISYPHLLVRAFVKPLLIFPSDSLNSEQLMFVKVCISTTKDPSK